MTSAPAALEALGAQPPTEPPAAPREPFLTRVKLLLRPSNFIAAVPGPIFNKDVWISGRKSGTYWIRFVYVILLLFTIAIVFAGNADDLSSTTSPTLRLQQLQQIAPITTKVLLWFQFITLAIVGTILGAPSICEEKRAGTLATLLTTPLKAWQIIIGKTCAFFVQLMILALIAAPLMLAIRVFGGVAAEEIIAGTVLMLSTALLAGLCAMLFSVSIRRTAGAIMGGLLLLVAIQGAVPLTWALTAAYFKRPVLPETWLVNASTPGALGIVTFGFTAPENLQGAWIYSTLYTLAICLLIVVVASWQLRKVMAREGAGGSAIPAATKVKKSKTKGTSAPTDDAAPSSNLPETAADTDPHTIAPNIKRRRRASTVQEGATRTVGDHPVLWREMRQSIFRSRWPVILLIGAVVLTLTPVYYFDGLKEDEAYFAIATIATVLCLLAAAVTPAAVISSEREARTLDVLLTTPLTARSIIFGKAAGSVRRQWILPALLCAHILIGVFARFYYHQDTISPIAFLWVFLLLVPPILFLTATGTLMSLICKKSAGASAASFGLALLLWFIAPGIITLLCLWAFRNTSGAEDFLSWLWAGNPLFCIGPAMEGATDGTYRVLDIRMDTIEMLLFGLFFATVYTGAAYLVLRWAASILAIRTARLR
jgi:ABC-type transport system involved in multi-copper enzyme maturation permease subunit